MSRQQRGTAQRNKASDLPLPRIWTSQGTQGALDFRRSPKVTWGRDRQGDRTLSYPDSHLPSAISGCHGAPQFFLFTHFPFGLHEGTIHSPPPPWSSGQGAAGVPWASPPKYRNQVSQPHPLNTLLRWENLLPTWGRQFFGGHQARVSIDDREVSGTFHCFQESTRHLCRSSHTRTRPP